MIPWCWTMFLDIFRYFQGGKKHLDEVICQEFRWSKQYLNTMQCIIPYYTMWGPQSIAKLVYNSNNYGLW